MPDLFVEVVQIVPETGDLAPHIEIAPETFARRGKEVVEAVTDVADTFHARLDERFGQRGKDRAWILDEVTMSFEIAVQAEAGVVIAKAKTGATFTAQLSWKRSAADNIASDDPDTDGPPSGPPAEDD